MDGSDKSKKKNRVGADEFALRKLNYGMKTESELRKLMVAAGYASAEIDETVEEFKTFDYINDERYVSELYRLGRNKGWSKTKISVELSKRGVKSELSQKILEEISADFDEKEEAFLIAKKIFDNSVSEGKPFDEKLKAKIGRRLIALGYNESICYHVINRLC